MDNTLPTPNNTENNDFGFRFRIASQIPSEEEDNLNKIMNDAMVNLSNMQREMILKEIFTLFEKKQYNHFWHDESRFILFAFISFIIICSSLFGILYFRSCEMNNAFFSLINFICGSIITNIYYKKDLIKKK